jgi:hypothetical protein
VIKIVALRIREFRGVRDATFRMDRRTFVVRGPNGSGKSGVVDAIQFALTGEIGRLTGTGTGDITLADHGPHVTQRQHPEQSIVDLTVQIASLGKTATITRSISKPRQFQVVPDTPDVRAVFAELETHPEITLARRDIIKLILIGGTERSRSVQALLHQDEIERARKALRTTETKVEKSQAEARRRTGQKNDALQRHLGVQSIAAEPVLAAVNARRRILGLQALTSWNKDTVFSAGVEQASAAETSAQGKASALADIQALIDAASQRARDASAAAMLELASIAGSFRADPRLLVLLQEADLTRAGVELLVGDLCPLCDREWNASALRNHLNEKLAKAAQVKELRKRCLELSAQIAGNCERIRSLLGPVSKVSELTEDARERLRGWYRVLRERENAMGSLEGVIGAAESLGDTWLTLPEKIHEDLEGLTQRVLERPEKGKAGEARDYLVVAQERFADLQQARRAGRKADDDAARGRQVYRAYCDASEATLKTLYGQLEADFVAYYRALNPDDEGDFEASLSPSEGALDLAVAFHREGMFPPGAYHSEGHQDGMGLCLYLALLKRVLGASFTLGVLDDVVMSVDSEHRRRICKLLKDQFPDTQFVITTHDSVWASQMRSQGLVSGERMVAFNGWSVETGPVIDGVPEVWQHIESDLACDDVPSAAAKLRRHAEFAARELAHNLGAQVTFKGDGAHELGELLPAVLSRYGNLLDKALKAARFWKNEDEATRIEASIARHTALRTSLGAEQWAVNPAVHYNEWANFTASEFRATVTSVREALGQLQCPVPACSSWLEVTPRINAQDLRCTCGGVRFNLRKD